MIVSFAIFVQCNQKAEIAQWRGPDRNGTYPGQGLLTQWPDSGPQLLWQYDSLGQGYASVAVTSKGVYTIGTVDSISYVFAFDHSGNLQYKKELGRDWMKSWPGIRSTPNVYDGLGYVLNGFGVLYCFDTRDGRTVWTKDIFRDYKVDSLEFGYCENLLVDGNKLFVTPASAEALVVALNRKTGDLIWKSEGTWDSIAYTSPILIERGGRKFFVSQTKKVLFAVETETGKIAWKYPLKGDPLPNTPMFRDGYLFAIDYWKDGGFMLKVSDDGYGVQEVWRNPNLVNQQGDMVLLGDRMYGVGGKGRTFSGIDWNTGKELFQDSTKAQIINVISADSLLYCYELRGAFKLMRPTETGFEKVGSFVVKGGTKLHCSHPVIRDGRLYVRHDNSLFVYSIRQV